MRETEREGEISEVGSGGTEAEMQIRAELLFIHGQYKNISSRGRRKKSLRTEGGQKEGWRGG